MYGLLGKTLKHSYSKTIHELIRPMHYQYFEVDDLKTFFNHTQFNGINVTIPYKKEVLNYVDTLDETVKITGSVNTIINNNGLLFAYNTDFLALKDLLIASLPPNKKTCIAVIGNGATMQTVVKALDVLAYTNVHVYARNPKDNEKHINQIDLKTTVLINTTPVGMYPNTQAKLPINLNDFKKLVFVFDVIYNPFNTHLIIDAKQKNIKTTNGLDMLIKQAIYSNQLFFGNTYDEALLDQIKQTIYKEQMNIVFVGLPFSGKTHYAKRLGNRLKKVFIDSDIVIEETLGKKIDCIFKEDGEAYFRKTEETVLLDLLKEHSQVIAPGGGIVENETIKQALKHNSIVIYLDLDETLMATINFKNRPKVKSVDELKALKAKRKQHYLDVADIIIKKDTLETRILLERIEAEIHAYFNH